MARGIHRRAGNTTALLTEDESLILTLTQVEADLLRELMGACTGEGRWELTSNVFIALEDDLQIHGNWGDMGEYAKRDHSGNIRFAADEDNNGKGEGEKPEEAEESEDEGDEGDDSESGDADGEGEGKGSEGESEESDADSEPDDSGNGGAEGDSSHDEYVEGDIEEVELPEGEGSGHTTYDDDAETYFYDAKRGK